MKGLSTLRTVTKNMDRGKKWTPGGCEKTECWPSGVVVPCIATCDKPQTAGFGGIRQHVGFSAHACMLRIIIVMRV